ncbi:MAG TPA: hypothetical protein VM327_00235 [Candidatus Thermoplasmatota archaeon]|nr:hypothetical protein [Candidatus Thermoplasmatota archaeon]
MTSMRSVVPVAILVLTSILMAGCAKDGGEEHLHYVCANGTEVHEDAHPEANATKAEDLAKFCPKSSTSGSKSNTTSQAPNVMPTLVLNITDDGGNVTPVTMLDGNLTFSAVGSKDADGTIAGIAVTVTDSNTTRTATLYDAAKKEFKDATFKFDRPGVVNVTVAMVDDRAGFSVNQTHVYVDHLQVLAPSKIQVPFGGGDSDICKGGPHALVEASWWKSYSFVVAGNASWIEATATAGEIAICSAAPQGEREQLSDTTGTEVSTPPGTPLPPPVGINSYQIGAFGDEPSQEVGATVLVHYEPDTRA